MIYFDELSVAEKMESDKSFSDGYSRIELIIYAKYLKYKKIMKSGRDYSTVSATQLKEYDKEVERELRLFCEGCCGTFNYTTDYQDIDFAVDNSNKYLLKLPQPLPITQKEWDAIQSVQDEKYQRMLFIMLVDAKYYRLFNTTVDKDISNLNDSIFYVRMTRSEIQKFAKVKYASPSEKTFFLGCITKKGLFGITENKLRTWFIKFVDTSSECVIDYVTDYDHLDLHYEKLIGNRIGQCKYCGKLFKQGKTKLSDYCYKHRGYSKKEIQKLICIDCGIKFEVGSKSREACRCKECQKLHARRLATERKRNQRMRDKVIKNNVTQSI